MSSMIEIRDLSKAYGSTQAVNGLTFEIPRGQVVGFLGPNGAGKTTTLRILTGYLLPTSGYARVSGVDIVEEPVLARRRLGYLPENNPLYEDMMVIDYLEYMAAARHIERSMRGQRIRSAVERCGIGDVIGKDIGALSKGYRQRVGFAQAILHEPDLLILDEPTSGLDPNQIIDIRALIRELGREKTVLMSTHILSEAQSTCSRILIIHNGKLVADDAPEILAQQEGSALIMQISAREGSVLDPVEVMLALQAIPGVLRIEQLEPAEGAIHLLLRCTAQDVRRQVFELVATSGWILLEMRRREASLEDVFRKLTLEGRSNA